MAYFNHAFNKTFLATSIAGANVATSALCRDRRKPRSARRWHAAGRRYEARQSRELVQDERRRPKHDGRARRT